MKNLLLALMVLFLAMPAWAEDGPKSSAYDRVMKTQTIRCGYRSFKPWIYRDLETGKMVGPTVEIMEEIAKQLSMKLEWIEKTDGDTLTTELSSKKIDVACPIMWSDLMRDEQMVYTTPLFYTSVHMYVRQGDKRFRGKVEEDINRHDIKIAVQEGEVSAKVAERYFPNAQIITLPQSSSGNELLLSVTTEKADATLVEATYIKDFNKGKKIRVEQVSLQHPVSGYGNTLAVEMHETELKEMLDKAVIHLLHSGKTSEIVERFNREYPASIHQPSPHALTSR